MAETVHAQVPQQKNNSKKVSVNLAYVIIAYLLNFNFYFYLFYAYDNLFIEIFLFILIQFSAFQMLGGRLNTRDLHIWGIGLSILNLIAFKFISLTVFFSIIVVISNFAYFNHTQNGFK